MKDKARIPVTFSVPAKEEWLLEQFDLYARMERTDRSKLIRRAMREYANRHGEGNPQKPLDFHEPSISPVARIEAGVRFLRAKNKLSYKQIALITGLSFRQIRKICYDSNKVIRRKIQGHVLEKYRQKWQLFKRGLSPEQAFKF